MSWTAPSRQWLGGYIGGLESALAYVKNAGRLREARKMIEHSLEGARRDLDKIRSEDEERES